MIWVNVDILPLVSVLLGKHIVKSFLVGRSTCYGFYWGKNKRWPMIDEIHCIHNLYAKEANQSRITDNHNQLLVTKPLIYIYTDIYIHTTFHRASHSLTASRFTVFPCLRWL